MVNTAWTIDLGGPVSTPRLQLLSPTKIRNGRIILGAQFGPLLSIRTCQLCAIDEILRLVGAQAIIGGLMVDARHIGRSLVY
jgi:hypothetical protein